MSAVRQVSLDALPGRREMETAMGSKPEDWAGSCHGAAMLVVEHVGPELATVRRGYFIGTIAPGAYFDGRPAQHSWVELRDGRVCDPTRFAFTGEPAWPLWVGPSDDYDIGGCETMTPAGRPPDVYESEREMVDIDTGCVDYLLGLLGLPGECYGEDWVSVSPEQLGWLAHLPIKDGEAQGVLARFFAAEVYQAIIDAGYSALIPIDRRDWILPEQSEGRSSF